MPSSNPLSLPIATVLITTLLASCGKSDKWSAFGYPKASDLTDFRYLGDFESLESCRAAVRAWRIGITDSGATDYECGKNCDGVPIRDRPVMCETTER